MIFSWCKVAQDKENPAGFLVTALREGWQLPAPKGKVPKQWEALKRVEAKLERKPPKVVIYGSYDEMHDATTKEKELEENEL